MNIWIWIAIGGACGAMARHGTNLLATRLLGSAFPFGTLLVNVVGCFIIGVIWQLLGEMKSPEWRPAVQFGLSTGFLGALTTFSTFGLEIVLMLESHSYWLAAANILLNLACGLVAVGLGIAFARAFF